MKTALYVSLTQAAKIVEASKPTILNAIKDGSLPVKGKTKQGGYEIDPSDLFALFEPRKKTTSQMVKKNRILPPKPAEETAPTIQNLEMEVQHLRELLAREEAAHSHTKASNEEQLQRERDNADKWRAMAESNQRLLTHFQDNHEKAPQKHVEKRKNFLATLLSKK